LEFQEKNEKSLEKSVFFSWRAKTNRYRYPRGVTPMNLTLSQADSNQRLMLISVVDNANIS
jgi:hypothetical protein